MRLPSPTSSEDEVASSQTSHSHTDAVVQTIVKGRKSWKASRGGELVWPPELEAALVEGALTSLAIGRGAQVPYARPRELPA